VLLEADAAADLAGRPAWDDEEIPGCEAAATVSGSDLVPAGCWKGPFEESTPEDRLTLTGRAASAPPPAGAVAEPGSSAPTDGGLLAVVAAGVIRELTRTNTAATATEATAARPIRDTRRR
jgi:hypothetical protein